MRCRADTASRLLSGDAPDMPSNAGFVSRYRIEEPVAPVHAAPLKRAL
jgi:hypothetical protein